MFQLFLVPFGTAGASGALIESIQVYPLGDIVASPLRIFLKASNSVEYILLLETSLTAVSGSGNTSAIAGYPIEVQLPRILTPASQTPATPNRAGRPHHVNKQSQFSID